MELVLNSTKTIVKLCNIKGSEMVLVPGMMFTIEPMINEGTPEFYVDEDNGWTVYTDDDGLSAG